MSEPQKERAIEKHIQTIFMAVTLAAIYWAGNSLIEQGKLQERVNGSINLIQAEQVHLKTLIESIGQEHYTLSHARHREKEVNARFISFERRVSHLEDRNEVR